MEQLTYLLFIKRLDEIHTIREYKAQATGSAIEDPVFDEKQQDLRWEHFKNTDPETMYATVSGKVFPFIKTLQADKGGIFTRYMKDASFMIPTSQLLSKVVDKLSALKMDSRDLKGDIYEYLLAELTTAGKNGQFRTPRHIIAMMVAIAAPEPGDTICDPASGTCGFLVGADEYLRKNHDDIFLDEAKKAHFNNHMFHGSDFDATMLRIGAMNFRG